LKHDDEVLREAGRPPHQPTDERRKYVRSLAAYGTPQEQIARVLDIDSKTLRLHYRDELDLAVIEANAKVAETLFRQATKEGNTTAAIWWTKSRMGWKERQAHEHSGPDGEKLTIVVGTGIERD
jgi:hypothetical protein